MLMPPPTPLKDAGLPSIGGNLAKQLIVTPDGLHCASPSASTVCSTPYATPHSDESFDALNTATVIGDSPAPHRISFPGQDNSQNSADSMESFESFGLDAASLTKDSDPAAQSLDSSIADQSMPLEGHSPLLGSQATDEYQVESQPLSATGFRCTCLFHGAHAALQGPPFRFGGESHFACVAFAVPRI
jgi:hypothetical protein